MLLKDKVVLVTGAGSGIGRAIAIACASEGAAVVVNDIGAKLDGAPADEQPGALVAEEIVARGGRSVWDSHSVADPAGAEAMVATAVAAFGRIDGVVNNAGILRDTYFHKMSQDDFDSVLRVHLYGSFQVSRAAARHFRDQGSGSFVHMTSTSALVGNFGQANYMAAKLGIAGLSRAIALDMERFGVCSNCVAPFAWSRMTSSLPTDTPEQKARVDKFRQMTPEKIAPLVVALLSQSAPGVTGQIFGVRKNEIMIMSQPRPLRSVQEGEGWSPQAVLDHAIPALAPAFTPLERSEHVFSWDPV